MTVMHTTLWAAASSFGMMQASAMAHKAWRELRRAQEAKSGQERVDAAINCAITAWHMTDWAWNGVVAVGRRDPDIARVLGATRLPLEKADLISWATSNCPELALCQGICNGSKHVKSDRTVDTRARSPSLSDASAPGVTTLIIVDGGCDRDALDVLQAAVDFWGRQATSADAMR